MIAREVAPGDRIVVGGKSYIVMARPEFVSENQVQVLAKDAEFPFGQAIKFACTWNSQLELEPST